MTTSSESAIPAEGHDRSLWLAVLGAPTLYLTHHELNYALVPWACSSGKRWLLTLISAVFLVLLAGSGLIAWRDHQRVPGSPDDTEPDAPRNRHRLLAALGVMLAALFFLLVLAQAAATLILEPCPE